MTVAHAAAVLLGLAAVSSIAFGLWQRSVNSGMPRGAAATRGFLAGLFMFMLLSFLTFLAGVHSYSVRGKFDEPKPDIGSVPKPPPGDAR